MAKLIELRYDSLPLNCANNAMEMLERTCRARCVEVRQLYIEAQHNFFGHHGQPPGENLIVEVPEVECVAGRGLRGDRFFDFKENYKGQITFLRGKLTKRFAANWVCETGPRPRSGAM